MCTCDNCLSTRILCMVSKEDALEVGDLATEGVAKAEAEERETATASEGVCSVEADSEGGASSICTTDTT